MSCKAVLLRDTLDFPFSHPSFSPFVSFFCSGKERVFSFSQSRSQWVSPVIKILVIVFASYRWKRTPQWIAAFPLMICYRNMILILNAQCRGTFRCHDKGSSSNCHYWWLHDDVPPSENINADYNRKKINVKQKRSQIDQKRSFNATTSFSCFLTISGPVSLVISIKYPRKS